MYVPTTITTRHNNSNNPTTNNSKYFLSAQYQENNKINEQNNTDIIHSSAISNIPFVHRLIIPSTIHRAHELTTK